MFNKSLFLAIFCCSSLELFAMQSYEVGVATAAEDNTCDITGLDKKEVLRALFNAAQVNMDSFHCARAALSELTEQDLDDALMSGGYSVEYLKGRQLKVNLRSNTVDVRLFNRYNGSGAGQRAIAVLRRLRR